VNIPKDVGFNDVYASFFGLVNQIFPHLHRKKKAVNKVKFLWPNKKTKLPEMEEENYIWGTSWVMYRARKKESPLAIDENGLSVVGNITVNPLQLNTQPQHQTKQCKLHFGN